MQTLPRWKLEDLQKSLSMERITIISGARQVGKTTIAKYLSPDNAIYRTLDDPTILKAALEDPTHFIKHNDELMIIDEIQRAPDLLLAIKMDVDINQLPGRFLLTGSADISQLSTVKESLAGRARKVRLRPFSQGEVQQKKPTFIADCINQTFSSFKSSYSKDDYIALAMRGGYPAALSSKRSLRDVQKWHLDYLDALLSNDLRDILNIRRAKGMRELTAILAAWSSKFMNKADIGSNLGLSRATLDAYINALELLFIVERLQPWMNTDYDCVGRTEKIFYVDTGLMSSTLGWDAEDIRLDGDRVGKLMETFVFNQLISHIESADQHCRLFNYRDKSKREIDFIIEIGPNKVIGIEVKSSSSISKESFKHLRWFQENLVPDKEFTGIVLYTGEHSLSFGKGLWAIPISKLF